MSREPKNKITNLDNSAAESKPTIVSNYDFIRNCSVEELAAFLADYESHVIEQIVGEDTVPVEVLVAEAKHLEEWLKSERRSIVGEYLN